MKHMICPGVLKKLKMICKDEQEHVDWGERETMRLIQENPSLKTHLLDCWICS